MTARETAFRCLTSTSHRPNAHTRTACWLIRFELREPFELSLNAKSISFFLLISCYICILLAYNYHHNILHPLNEIWSRRQDLCAFKSKIIIMRLMRIIMMINDDAMPGRGSKIERNREKEKMLAKWKFCYAKSAFDDDDDDNDENKMKI